MKYFTYGRKQVDGEWNHPVGFLPEFSTYAIEYLSNYYGSAELETLEVIADFDPSEISKEMYDEAVASGSLPVKDASLLG